MIVAVTAGPREPEFRPIIRMVQPISGGAEPNPMVMATKTGWHARGGRGCPMSCKPWFAWVSLPVGWMSL